MKLMSRNGAIAALVAATTVVALGACASPAPSEPDGPVEITVMGIPATTREDARKAFLQSIEDFEAENPNITVVPSEAKYDARTWATSVAGGTAETVVWVPFTDVAGLVAREQVADLTSGIKELGLIDDLDPRILQPMTNSDGQIFGLPTSSYALGLAYNRAIFEQAGLDPDDPPTTWDEVREAAKTISDATGIPGFAEMTTGNAGGWHLTAGANSFGGQMLTDDDGTWVPDFANDAAISWLELMKAMRWEDNSMGSEQLRSYEDINRDFAAGKVAMVVSAPDMYTNYIQQFGGIAEDFGVTSYPQAGGDSTLIGGSVAMVDPKATEQEVAAALKWINYYWVAPKFDPALAATRAEANAASNIPVGVPGVPFFTEAVTAAVDKAVAPFVNVDLDHFRPYVDGTAALSYQPEPAVAAQDIYATLDSVLQAVLTDQSTDPKTALLAAQDAAAPVIQRAQ